MSQGCSPAFGAADTARFAASAVSVVVLPVPAWATTLTSLPRRSAAQAGGRQAATARWSAVSFGVAGGAGGAPAPPLGRAPSVFFGQSRAQWPTPPHLKQVDVFSSTRAAPPTLPLFVVGACAWLASKLSASRASRSARRSSSSSDSTSHSGGVGGGGPRGVGAAPRRRGFAAGRVGAGRAFSRRTGARPPCDGGAQGRLAGRCGGRCFGGRLFFCGGATLGATS